MRLMYRIWLSFLILIITFSTATTDQKKEIRYLKVKVVVDEECNLEKKRNFITSLVNEVSIHYQKEFAIGFTITHWQRWESPNSARKINQLVPDLFKQINKGESEIVLGFTFQKGLRGRYAIAFNKEGYVLVRTLKVRSLWRKVLKHELAHLFGATHINDEESIMDRFLRGNRFKALNSEIIRLQRLKDFRGMDSPPPKAHWKPLIDLYQKLIEANETLDNHHFTRARKLLYRRWLLNPQTTANQLLEVQKAYNNLEKAYVYLSFIYMEMGDFNQVINQCLKAVRINPEFYAAYNLMGIAYRKSGQLDKALKYYRKALTINKTSSKIYFNLGIVHSKKGQKKKAVRAYDKAIKLNPNFANAWNNLGCIYLEEGNHQQASKVFQKALNRDLSSPLIHSNYAHALLSSGDIPRR